ncbi:hypothetical protein D4R87_03150 [bacterium]|nr:MAG: hypothetical protein D4R87_03150 [bacterium]
MVGIKGTGGTSGFITVTTTVGTRNVGVVATGIIAGVIVGNANTNDGFSASEFGVGMNIEIVGTGGAITGDTDGLAKNGGELYKDENLILGL